MRISTLGYLATKDTEQRSGENPNWKVSAMTILTSMDVGRNVISTEIIGDPIPLEAMDHLLNMEYASMQELIKLIPQADNPLPILRMLMSKWSVYQMNGPVIRMVPLKNASVLHTDEKSQMKAIRDESRLVYMDRANMEPQRIRSQKISVMNMLLQRLNAGKAEDYGIKNALNVLATKIRGRIISTDVASRLNSPLYNAYFALSMGAEYGRRAQAAYDSGNIEEALLFGYIQIELLVELKAVMSDPTISTFTRSEIPDARHLDNLKWWFEALELMAPVVSLNFRRIPVGHRLICESASRGRWTLVMTPKWKRIYYEYLITKLDISGFQTAILWPTKIEDDTKELGPYRTTRDPGELGIELTIQRYPESADKAGYSGLISVLQTAMGERDFMDAEYKGTYPKGIDGEDIIPLRNAILRQLPQMQVLQPGISIDILASDVMAVKTPAVLLDILEDVVYKYKPTVFETISPWIPS